MEHHNPIQQYKEQSISTMTPNELLLLLYDELVKNLVRCELALDQQQYELLEASATPWTTSTLSAKTYISCMTTLAISLRG